MTKIRKDIGPNQTTRRLSVPVSLSKPVVHLRYLDRLQVFEQTHTPELEEFLELITDILEAVYELSLCGDKEWSSNLNNVIESLMEN